MIVLNRLLVCFFVLAASARAQPQVFTSTRIKPAASSDVQSRQMRVSTNGDLISTSVNAISLIGEAYNVPGNPSDRLKQLPPWVYGERYDIEARVAPSFGSRSPANDPQAVRTIFRQLLTERFGLVVQTDSKSVPVYALIVASNGPKLMQSATTDCIFDTKADGCHTFQVAFGHPLNANAIDMDDLALYIENWTDMPVVNRTNLPGLYQVSTSGWRPMHLPPPPPGGNGDVDFSQLPTLDSVLLRLGLKLQKAEAAIPFYTVEHIDRPTLDK